MANSKYEYVKSFEFGDEIMLPNFILVRIEGRNFSRFSEANEFVKPNDLKALYLMNACGSLVLEEFPDLVFAYGFGHEYSFIFKKYSKFYQRRARFHYWILFTSVYVAKWKEFLPSKELVFPPSFKSRVIGCPTLEVLQSYISWRQRDCHLENQYNTCFWMLIESGMSEKKAKEILEGTQKQEINEILFQQFNTNYKNLPDIFRQGSCTVKTEKELKYQPHFDGQAVCYPSCHILRDYLAWRQVDCHINNQHNTCFWMLVKKSGMSKSKAQKHLKGTQVKEKSELLKRFQIDDYNTLDVMFRHGSSVFWDKEEYMVMNETEDMVGKFRKKLVVEHCNIIERSFWKAHPHILQEDC